MDMQQLENSPGYTVLNVACPCLTPEILFFWGHVNLPRKDEGNVLMFAPSSHPAAPQNSLNGISL